MIISDHSLCRSSTNEQWDKNKYKMHSFQRRCGLIGRAVSVGDWNFKSTGHATPSDLCVMLADQDVNSGGIER